MSYKVSYRCLSVFFLICINTTIVLSQPGYYTPCTGGRHEIEIYAKWNRWAQKNSVTDKTLEYQWLKPINDSLAIVDKDGKKDVINNNGKLIIPLNIAWLNVYEPDFYVVNEKDRKSRKRLKVKLKNDLAILQVVIEKREFLVVNPKKVLHRFDEINAVSRDFFVVKSNGKQGIMNNSGKIVFPTKYDSAGFWKGLYYLKLGKEWSIYSSKRKLIAKFDSLDIKRNGLIAVSKNGEYGAIDERSKVVIPLKYDQVYPVGENLMRIKLNGKFGIVNKKGKTVLEAKYDYIQRFREGVAGVKLDGKSGYVDRNGNIAIPLKFDGVYEFEDGLAYVRVNKKYGFIDKIGKVVIPIKYETASRFSDGVSRVQLNGKFGYINKKEEEFIPIKYDEVSFFREKYFVTLNGKGGLYDKNGKAILPAKYNKHKPAINKDYYLVYIDGKAGLVDKNGKEIISPKYDKLRFFNFRSNLLSVSLNGKVGVVNTSGKVTLPIEYDEVETSFYNDFLAKIKLGGKIGFINLKGKLVVSPKYSKVDFFSGRHDEFLKVNENGWIYKDGTEVVSSGIYRWAEPVSKDRIVVYNGEKAVLDENGKIIIPFGKYAHIHWTKQNIAIVRDKNSRKPKLINKFDNVIVPLKYDGFEEAHNGFFYTILDKKRGLVDKNGEEIVPPKFNRKFYFYSGLSHVQSGDKYGMIDRSGKEVIPLKYQFISGNSKGLLLVKLDGKFGFIDKKDNEIIPIIYEDARAFTEDFATVQLNGKWGAIDKKGKTIIPFKFDYIAYWTQNLFEVGIGKKRGLINKDGKTVTPMKFDSFWCPTIYMKLGFLPVMHNGKFGYFYLNSKKFIENKIPLKSPLMLRH